MIKHTMTHLFTSVFAIFGTFTWAHAQAGGTYENPIKLGIKTIPEFLLALVDIVFLFGMPIIVIFIVYAGFLFVTAGDNDSQISKAKTTLIWTLVGAAVLIGAKVLSDAIQATVLSLA